MLLGRWGCWLCGCDEEQVRGQGQSVIDMCHAMHLLMVMTLKDNMIKMVHKYCLMCSGQPGLCSEEDFWAWNSQVEYTLVKVHQPQSALSLNNTFASNLDPLISSQTQMDFFQITQ